MMLKLCLTIIETFCQKLLKKEVDIGIVATRT